MKWLHKCSFLSLFFHLLAAIAGQMQTVLKVIVESISVDKDALTGVGLDDKTVHFKTQRPAKRSLLGVH